MESHPDKATHVLQTVFDGLRTRPRPDGLGKIIQIISAKSQSGTSHVARNLALIAARQMQEADGKRVGLFDCDFCQLAQTKFFFSERRAGQMQGPYDASFGVPGFWQIAHRNGTVSESPYIYGLYLERQTGLAVTSLFWDQIAQNDRITLRRSQAYWQTLRSHFSYIFVDSPALDRSSEGMMISPDCDGSILIAPANEMNDQSHEAARLQILQSGGQYIGLLLNAGAPMRLIRQNTSPASAQFRVD